MNLNKERTGIEQKFFELCLKVVQEEGLSLYDMEYISGSSTLRVYIYNQDTNTAILDECARVDRAFTPYAEALDWLPEKLMLEVSSPGIYRNLNTTEHFEKAVGEKVRFSLLKKLDPAEFSELPKSLKGNRKFIAILKELKDESVLLDADGFELTLAFEDIKKANLEPDI